MGTLSNLIRRLRAALFEARHQHHWVTIKTANLSPAPSGKQTGTHRAEWCRGCGKVRWRKV